MMMEEGGKVLVAEIDGEVVGFACWTATPGDNSWFEKFELSLLKLEARYSKFFDKGLDKQRYKQLLQVDEFSFYDDLEKTGYLHLGLLAVSPQHQRKGIATELVKWGFEYAEREQMPCTLEGSVMGRPLYEKLGFKTIETGLLRDDVEVVAMLWEPPALGGKWLERDGAGNAKLKQKMES